MTHNNAYDSIFWVTAALQVLRNNGENTGRKSHVEDAVRLIALILKIIENLVEVVEGLILVVLAVDVGTDLQEVVELLLNLLGRGLDG